MRIRRSSAEIQELFEDQISFLVDSCRRFDNESTTEYRRIANTIRTLVKDSNNNHSLIRQIGREGRYFVNSARALRPQNKLSECNLVELVLDPDEKSPRYRASLDAGEMEFLPFDDWWNQPVMGHPGHLPLTRKKIILSVAEQDGGTHVDPAIDAAFEQLRQDGFKWAFASSLSDIPQALERTAADRYAVRQIGHEVLKSILPDYARANRTSGFRIEHGLIFQEINAPNPPGIQGYHLTDIADPCPCMSGKKFGDCHTKGMIKPYRKENTEMTAHLAPPGAVYARFFIKR